MKSTNKLKISGLFYAPKTQEELYKWIENLSGSEKALAYIVSGMTWNLCANLVNGDSEMPQEN